MEMCKIWAHTKCVPNIVYDEECIDQEDNNWKCLACIGITRFLDVSNLYYYLPNEDECIDDDELDFNEHINIPQIVSWRSRIRVECDREKCHYWIKTCCHYEECRKICKKGTMFRCKGVYSILQVPCSVRYCSRKCQKKDWSWHRGIGCRRGPNDKKRKQ